MLKHGKIRFVVSFTLIVQALLMLVAPAAAAPAPEPPQSQILELPAMDYVWPTGPFLKGGTMPAPVADDLPQISGRLDPSVQAQQMTTTTLEVSIISSPWATLDHNKPVDPDSPHVFVVAAVDQVDPL